MAQNYGAKISREGLVLLLDAATTKSYPGTGTTWYDLSGNGNNVTATNGPVWNSSGYFVNDADSYFSGSGTSSIPTGNQPYCIGVWARQPSTWGSNYGLISIGGFGTTNQSNALRTLNNAVGNFHHYWWGNDLSATTNSTNIALNKWFFVLAQFNGTTREIWANGVKVSSNNPTGHNVTSTTIQISKTYSTEYQRGDIANAFIFNRALSADEVQQNFEAFRGRFGI